jgi:hypothetical protein
MPLFKKTGEMIVSAMVVAPDTGDVLKRKSRKPMRMEIRMACPPCWLKKGNKTCYNHYRDVFFLVKGWVADVSWNR